MKYVITLLLGLAVGVTLAAGLLYVNPLAIDSGQALVEADDVFGFESPLTGELAFASDGLSRLTSHPSGVPDLWETAIVKSALSVIALKDSTGAPVGVASRVSYPAETTELLTTGVLLNDDWLVSLPDSGSFFVTSQANWWPFLKETVIPVWYFGQPWSGSSAIDPTIGPDSSGHAIVTGATGEFVGRFGNATEHYDVREFDTQVGPRQLAAELRVAWHNE